MVSLTNDNYMNYDTDEEELKNNYKFFIEKLSDEQKKEFEIHESSTRQVMQALSNNLQQLIAVKSQYDYEFNERKWYKSTKLQIILYICLFSFFAYLFNEKLITFLQIGFTSIVVLIVQESRTNYNMTLQSTIISQRTIEHERYKSELLGRGLTNHLLEQMIKYDKNILAEQYHNYYVTYSSDKTNEYNKLKDDAETLYPKLHYICNLQLMRFITRADIFKQESKLYEKITKDSNYKWLDY